MHHDFTGHINCLSQQLEHQGPRQLILRHTLLPVYFPFHTPSRCENWIERLLLGSPSSMKAELGLFASRFSAAHPLKACAQCMESDSATYGTPYWHVEHQLPGVTACHTHRAALLFSRLKISGQDRFAWLLPTEASLQTPSSPHPPNEALSLTEIAKGLWKLPVEFLFDHEVLRQTYLVEALATGCSDPRSKRLNFQALRCRVSEVIGHSNLAEHEPWLAETQADELMASRFVRMLHSTSPREMHHPLNHMILILTLFGGWSAFWSAYKRLSQHSHDEVGFVDTDSPTNCGLEPGSDTRSRLMSLVRTGWSASAAAQAVGIATNTAVSWLASEGITVQARPKTLLPPLRRKACLELQRGEDKESVARSVGVSIQTITRLLFAEPGLHARWQSARFSAAQARARKAWTRSMQSCPDSASNEWRLLAPAAYAWLYRNDRHWLSEIIRNRNVPVRRKSTRVNWNLRDQRLEMSILEAVQTDDEGNRRPLVYTVVELCTRTPLLRRHIGNLGLLPRTMQLLSRLCRRRSTLLTKQMPLLQ